MLVLCWVLVGFFCVETEGMFSGFRDISLASICFLGDFGVIMQNFIMLPNIQHS